LVTNIRNKLVTKLVPLVTNLDTSLKTNFFVAKTLVTNLSDKLETNLL